jgi:hypothetical protein
MADQTDLWLGGEPFSNYGPALNFGPARNRSLPPELLDFGQVGPAARPQQWRAFGSAIAAIQNVAGDAPPGPGSANMRSNTYGGLLGFDYQASPNALLGLAVLLSFAQFERELIGERVRDKIAASKRKGVWVGGPVPLGYAAFDKKVVVVTDEAAAVRTIFARYLELGSVRALADDLARRGIRSKAHQLSNGRTIGGGPFGVGALAYLLKNRFYLGEVAYRGEVHPGPHEAILDAALFAAVQERLAAHAVARRCRLRGSAALLAGRLFDERGNRMSPSHTNKAGVRYRYYVSQAVLQNKRQATGSIGRVPAAEIEALVMAALRNHLQANGPGQADNDRVDASCTRERELIERHVGQVTLTPSHIELHLRQCVQAVEPTEAGGQAGSSPPQASVTKISIPWTSPVPAAVKGIIHVPAHSTPMTPSRREALLIAIAKARNWVDDLAHGRAASLAAIARRHGKVERHVRLLAQLAFVSPRIVAAILDATAPAGLTVTALAHALPWSWAEQEQQIGLNIAAAPHDE